MKALRFSRFYLLVTFLILCSWEAVQAAPAITISPASGPPPPPSPPRARALAPMSRWMCISM